MILHIKWRNKWPNLVFITILFLWIISLFLVPVILSESTVRNLHGHSTFIDNLDELDNLPFYPKAVYLTGDFLCHQKDSRCFIINGNQMPICVRCLSIYIGFLSSLILTLLISNDLSKNEYFLRILTYKIRKKLISRIGIQFLPILIIVVFLLPIAIDGGLQLLTSYESNSILRIITGFPAGWMGGFLLGAVVNT